LAGSADTKEAMDKNRGKCHKHICALRILAVLLLLAGGMPIRADVPATAPSSESAPASASAFRSGNIQLIQLNKDGVGEKLSLDALKAIAPPVSLKVFDPHENRDNSYRAFPAPAAFDAVFGKDWKNAGEIVFVSTDGYLVIVPVAKFIAHAGYLAFAYDDGAPFTITNRLQNNERLQLGPLYLVWDNMNSKVA
jgi:hypothetical protein